MALWPGNHKGLIFNQINSDIVEEELILYLIFFSWPCEMSGRHPVVL